MPHIFSNPRKLPTTILIAIDLGTTYSSISWAEQCEGTKSNYLRDWPNTAEELKAEANVDYFDKVPSEIAYGPAHNGTTQPMWGYQIPLSMPRFQWFKLSLEPKIEKLLKELSHTPRDPRRMNCVDEQDPLKVTTAFLTAMRNHLMDQIRRELRVSKSRLKDYLYKFIIAIPGIWSSKATGKTIRCAKEAGFGKMFEMQIISEPEAAMFEALKCYGHEPNFDVGATVVVCDAGGGTVDLVTVTIIERDPALCLRESCPGAGDLCGSIFLNRAFEKLVEEKLHTLPAWSPSLLAEAVVRFEEQKKNFSNTWKISQVFRFRDVILGDDPEKGTSSHTLTISWDEMEKKVFKPIVARILTLVLAQIKLSQRPVETVILTGGFGQSPYLREEIIKALPDGIKLYAPANGWAAVSAGAFLKALSGPAMRFESHIAKYSFGIQRQIPYDEKYHEGERRYIANGNACVDIMEWFILKGQSIRDAQSFKVTNSLFWKRGKPTDKCVRLYQSDAPLGVEPPYYPRKEKPALHATVKFEFVPNEQAIEAKCTKQGDYYEIPYTMTLGKPLFQVKCSVSSSFWSTSKVCVDQT